MGTMFFPMNLTYNLDWYLSNFPDSYSLWYVNLETETYHNIFRFVVAFIQINNESRRIHHPNHSKPHQTNLGQLCLLWLQPLFQSFFNEYTRINHQGNLCLKGLESIKLFVLLPMVVETTKPVHVIKCDKMYVQKHLSWKNISLSQLTIYLPRD